MAAVLALSGTFEELYSLFVFAVWIFFALTAIAVIRLRIREPELSRPYRAWGYPWTPLIFLFAAVALTDEFVDGAAGAVVVGAVGDCGGVPFFYRWRKRTL